MSFASIVSVSENKSILSDHENCMNNEGKEEEECTEITLDSQQQLLLEKYSRKNKTTRKKSNVPLHSSNMVPCSKGIENTTSITTTGSEESDIVITKPHYEINNSIKCCKQDDVNNNNFSSPEFFIEMLLQLPPKISRLISEVKRNRKHINLVDKERDNLAIQLATLTKTYEKGGYGMSKTSTMGADTVAADDHSLELIRLRKVCKSMEVERLSLIQNLEKSEELRKQQEDVILVLQRCTLQGKASEVTTCDERYKIVEIATTAALPSLPVPPERIRSQKDRSNRSLLRSNVASCRIGTNLVTAPASSGLNTEPASSQSPTHSKSTMTQPRRRSLASTTHTKTQYDRDRMLSGTAASARRRISKHNTLEPCGPRSRKTIFS